jgi:hypothetical protein
MTPSLHTIFVAALVCCAGAARVLRAGLGSKGAAPAGDEEEGAAGAAAAAAARGGQQAFAASAGNSVLEPGSPAWARTGGAPADSALQPQVALEVAGGGVMGNDRRYHVLGPFTKATVSKKKKGSDQVRIIAFSVRRERRERVPFVYVGAQQRTNNPPSPPPIHPPPPLPPYSSSHQLLSPV